MKAFRRLRESLRLLGTGLEGHIARSSAAKTLWVVVEKKALLPLLSTSYWDLNSPYNAHRTTNGNGGIN